MWLYILGFMTEGRENREREIKGDREIHIFRVKKDEVRKQKEVQKSKNKYTRKRERESKKRKRDIERKR